MGRDRPAGAPRDGAERVAAQAGALRVGQGHAKGGQIVLRHVPKEPPALPAGFGPPRFAGVGQRARAGTG